MIGLKSDFLSYRLITDGLPLNICICSFVLIRSHTEAQFSIVVHRSLRPTTQLKKCKLIDFLIQIPTKERCFWPSPTYFYSIKKNSGPVKSSFFMDVLSVAYSLCSFSRCGCQLVQLVCLFFFGSRNKDYEIKSLTYLSFYGISPIIFQ